MRFDPLKAIRSTFWLGDVIKDYGVISRGRRSLAPVSVSVTLRERHGRAYLVIRDEWRGFGYSSRWIELDGTAIERLEPIIHDALGRIAASDNGASAARDISER